jgi:thiol-disulfide isomerase/thioredoxin
MRPVTPHRLLLALVALALIAAACGGTDAAAPGGSGHLTPGASPEVPARNAAVAPLLPTDALELPDFDLATYQELLRQMEGTPVLVNIWGSWCGPCRDEAPNLAAAHERYGDRVQFLGVDILDVREGARAFMREFGLAYPSVYDGPGAIRDGLGLLGQPWTLLYDASGGLVDRWVGPAPASELNASLARVVAA